MRPQILRVPGSVRIAYGVTVLLFLGFTIHAATSLGGDGLDSVFLTWVTLAVEVCCALVCLARAWHVRAERLAWLLIGLGILSWATADFYYSLHINDVVALPIPSLADALWLAQYPLSMLAVILLMRARHTTSGARAWLDGSIAGLAVAAISAAIVLPSVISGSSSLRDSEYLTNLSYPVADIILLGAVSAALGARQWRLDRMWGSLALGFLAFTVCDIVYLVKAAAGTWVDGTIMDAGWLVAGLALAFAAWQPVEHKVAAGHEVRSALLFPSGFGAASLLLLIWDHFDRLPLVVIVLASASVTAALARMTLAFAENLRMVVRLRREAEVLATKNEQLLEVDHLKEELRQVQKMDALGQLAGGVAHDFNNLLTVVSGYTGLLGAKLTSDPAASRQLDAIATATERASDLTRQLLTFSRRQVTESSQLDLNEVVLETAAMIASALGDEIRVVMNLDDEVAPIHAERGQVSQVLVNLIFNARDAMPNGGTIEIATADGPQEALRDAAVDGAGRSVLLTVKDTGSGIDPETQARMFEPFFSTKGANGTGLGLATVYGIVEGGGGSISVVSTPGAGSTFSVLLPAAITPPPALLIRVPAADQTSESHRVLLVEDERAVRELVAEQLEALGHEVVAVPTPARACEIFEHRGDDFDLVVTDVVMPGIDGWQLANCLREQRPDLPVLLMSGYTNGAVGNVDLTGSTAFLQKPFTIVALAAKVEAVVAHPHEPAGPKTLATR
jgi:signal transduction histidine kinase/CheY-like chemotaxis protein